MLTLYQEKKNSPKAHFLQSYNVVAVVSERVSCRMGGDDLLQSLNPEQRAWVAKAPTSASAEIQALKQSLLDIELFCL